MWLVVSLSVFFEKVVLVLKFVRNFTNKKLSPSMKNIKSSSFVVALLFGLHISKLVWQFK